MQLMLAGQINPQSAKDYWPGPLKVSDASTTSTAIAQCNKVWKLNKSDIDN